MLDKGNKIKSEFTMVHTRPLMVMKSVTQIGNVISNGV